MFLTTPFTDLRLHTPELALAPVDAAGLDALVAVLPDDVELDPRVPRYAGLGAREQRAAVLRQSVWSSAGAWRVDDWSLAFVVRAGGAVVGAQGLEGTDFLHTRTVDSSSWLVPETRGRGWGGQARAAVLALAFGPLGAQFAVTSAWHDNHASLAVSRRLGYEPNGETVHHGADRVGAMAHLRLRRAAWSAGGRGDEVRIEGFEPCRPYFGLDGREPRDLGPVRSGR